MQAAFNAAADDGDGDLANIENLGKAAFSGNARDAIGTITKVGVGILAGDLGFPPQAAEFVGDKAAKAVERLLLGPPHTGGPGAPPVYHCTYTKLKQIPYVSGRPDFPFLVAAQKNGVTEYFSTGWNDVPWWPKGYEPLGLIFPGDKLEDLYIQTSTPNPYAFTRKLAIPKANVKVVIVDGKPFRIDGRLKWVPSL